MSQSLTSSLLGPNHGIHSSDSLGYFNHYNLTYARGSNKQYRKKVAGKRKCKFNKWPCNAIKQMEVVACLAQMEYQTTPGLDLQDYFLLEIL